VNVLDKLIVRNKRISPGVRPWNDQIDWSRKRIVRSDTEAYAGITLAAIMQFINKQAGGKSRKDPRRIAKNQQKREEESLTGSHNSGIGLARHGNGSFPEEIAKTQLPSWIAWMAGLGRLQTSRAQRSDGCANFCGFFNLDQLAGFDIIHVAVDGDGARNERVIADTLDIVDDSLALVGNGEELDVLRGASRDLCRHP